ncbi:hypothetical protein EJD04_17655 [Salmonella enterica]|nr:hypothetical protein [Salmonella enterica]EAU4678977.1 hypothetical protein [Salmonella enterica]EBJ7484582.1 hypothetical protein [Salmonella enterica]ECI4529866.1 hypothetical protein [Salmonella enterica subsp. diarizonae]SQI64224.1 Uncharacterised protein [Salmonella enterica subsp. diarizonae]
MSIVIPHNENYLFDDDFDSITVKMTVLKDHIFIAFQLCKRVSLFINFPLPLLCHHSFYLVVILVVLTNSKFKFSQLLTKAIPGREPDFSIKTSQ